MAKTNLLITIGHSTWETRNITTEDAPVGAGQTRCGFHVSMALDTVEQILVTITPPPQNRLGP